MAQAEKEKNRSLSAQLMLYIIVAALISGAVFCGLYFLGRSVVEKNFGTWEFQQEELSRKVSQFQHYVTDNDIAAFDAERISEWADKHPLVILEIHRGRFLLYSSIFQKNEQIKEIEGLEWYDWQRLPVQFSDGWATVFLYYDVTYDYYTAFLIGEIILCGTLFLFLLLGWSRRLIHYIGLLSSQIQVMAVGDFHSPVTVKGRSELSALAKNLDELRLAFRSQREQEAAYYAANQELITQMSHDLRTPLTTLMLYTEILKHGKYDGEDQLRDYLSRIDGKARQIKDLADNIFHYSLQSADAAGELAEKTVADRKNTPLRTVYEPVIADAIQHLEQSGFSVSAELTWPAEGVTVTEAYGRRILDNIISNILKYADSASPVQIAVSETGDYTAMCISNTIRKDGEQADSNGVGLASVRTMMQRQDGACHVEQTDTVFTVTLLFPNETNA